MNPTLIAILLLASVTVLASAATIGADLTLLFQNDLNWTTATDHVGAILIDKPVSYDAARKACNVLNESLLHASGPYIRNDLERMLGYQAQRTGRQRVWASGMPGECASLDDHGTLKTISCDTKLPALCSQSAPYRPNSETDLSERYHVQVVSSGLEYTGTRDKLSFRFLGIPYADPPTRFAYSQVFSKPTANISALRYGAACVQGDGSGSEDCLFLNIYTPYIPATRSRRISGQQRSKNLRPVMVFIHGGGFVGGHASNPVQDGGNIASRGDVVFVSIQYRLGTLGFLALDDGKTNGNFGLADQITALQWVQRHIAAFGGDPARVTILGNSAGGASVRALLAAKPAFGLFKGAIAHSSLGGFGYAKEYAKYFTVREEERLFGRGVVDAVGCGNHKGNEVLGCLRKVPAKALVQAPSAPRYIVVDGTYITTDELKVNGDGPAADAHVIFGWTRDDGANFNGRWPSEETTALQQIVSAGLNEEIAKRALDSGLFPLPSGPNATWNLFNQTSRISTDGQFRCANQATLASAAKHDVFRSVYGYQFDRTYKGWEPLPGTCNPPPTEQHPHGDPRLPYFRCHDGELYYVLGNLGQESLPFRDAGDLVLTQLAVDTWTSFARTYDPTPSVKYLDTRGYTGTKEFLRKYGGWEPVRGLGGGRAVKLFGVPWVDLPWLEKEQCEVLGYPIDSMYG